MPFGNPGGPTKTVRRCPKCGEEGFGEGERDVSVGGWYKNAFIQWDQKTRQAVTTRERCGECGHVEHLDRDPGR